MTFAMTPSIRQCISFNRVDADGDLEVSEAEIAQAASDFATMGELLTDVLQAPAPTHCQAEMASLASHSGEPLRIMSASVHDRIDTYRRAHPDAVTPDVLQVIRYADSNYDGRVTQRELNNLARSSGVSAETRVAAGILGLRVPRGGVRTR